VHAGALEYRIAGAPEGAVPGAIADSVAIIRENAHLSLEELRDVLQVLRAGDIAGEGDAGRQPPSPTLAEVPTLVDEAREAGQVVTLAMAGTDLVPVPAAVQRTVFRVVQEGLTNARKHAPGSAVDVLVQVRPGGGAPGGSIEATVSNPLAPGVTAAEMPGARRGHVGLAERAAHLGGRLVHTVESGCFVLTATIPLPRGAGAGAGTIGGADPIDAAAATGSGPP
jgi:signal transduction histidine kinase